MKRAYKNTPWSAEDRIAVTLLLAEGTPDYVAALEEAVLEYQALVEDLREEVESSYATVEDMETKLDTLRGQLRDASESAAGASKSLADMIQDTVATARKRGGK